MFAALLFAAALAPDPAHDPALGRYAVRAGARTVCTLTFRYEPTVGGEVEPARTCQGPLADAARWYPDGQGGYRLDDPIRQRVGAVAEDEAGMTLTLKDGRRFAFVKLDAPRMRTDAERATGWWSVRTDDPSKVVCRIELKPGGAVGPAAACPTTLKPYGGGRWSAGANGVTLTAKGASARSLRWGDAVSLLGPGRLIMLHD
jgi:hypothetical protein